MGMIPLSFLVSLLTAYFFKHKIEVLTNNRLPLPTKNWDFLVESVEKQKQLKLTDMGLAYKIAGMRLQKMHFVMISPSNTTAMELLISLLFYNNSAMWHWYVLWIFGFNNRYINHGWAYRYLYPLSGRALTPLAGLPNLFCPMGKSQNVC